MKNYKIVHIKTGHEQIIDEEGYNLLAKKGWLRQYDIEEITIKKTSTFLPPEINLKENKTSNHGRKTQRPD